jgi:hypothetical protein
MSKNIEFNNTNSPFIKENNISTMSATIKDEKSGQFQQALNNDLKIDNNTHPNNIIIEKNTLLLSKDTKLPEKSGRTRCEQCSVKISIVTQFTCRCSKKFCSKHRYADEHNCTFDYVKHDRDILTKANNKVVGDKLERI